jgi:hypothetical protein
MATFPPIVVDNIPELQNAVWHVGVDSAPPEVVPGWNTANENGLWTFTNSDFTAEADLP